MGKNTICLWYDKDAEAAARFYAETFPDSVVGAVHRAPSDYPSGKAGDVLMVESGGFEPLHLRYPSSRSRCTKAATHFITQTCDADAARQSAFDMTVDED